MSEKSDFFEALRKKAESDLCPGCGAKDGVNTTIEALKEAMIGGPMKGHIHVWFHQDIQYTSLHYTDRYGVERKQELGSCNLPDYPKDGTDGEEVAVLVVRMEKEKK